MRKVMTALILAASILPVAAQAADSRPVAVSYAAPANLGAGMRVGAHVGAQQKDDGVVGTLLIAAVAFGAGYLVREWTHHHHHYASSN